ncbi:hypothetical protein JOB18_041158 [Solea senegalensis]|uniref:Uncharacterized protein n=1 Tax=Solea senegalensis TaxID=28829 RepID=A0AAV6T191_SOLSE|nr:hypothetical protein JOB18_041158 [Solea senegalensis]
MDCLDSAVCAAVVHLNEMSSASPLPFINRLPRRLCCNTGAALSVSWPQTVVLVSAVHVNILEQLLCLSSTQHVDVVCDVTPTDL